MSILPEMNKPIFIFGLGRSGTTWVSDIVSKYSGRLVLFEPLHPKLFGDVRTTIYRESALTTDLIRHIDGILNKHIKHDWLLRNHPPSTIDKVDPKYVETIWSLSEIIGLKSIRLNTSFASLVEHYSARAIYIIRHPLAVIASIQNRPHFWEDLGWREHWSQLNNEVGDSNFKKISAGCSSHIEQLAFVWGYLNLQALKQLDMIKKKPVFYEDLYANPFEHVKVLLTSLELYDHPIHPSHIFTPSMVSLNTLHSSHYSSLGDTRQSLDFFWRDTLKDDQIRSIRGVIRKLCDSDQNLAEMCAERNYL